MNTKQKEKLRAKGREYARRKQLRALEIIRNATGVLKPL